MKRLKKYTRKERSKNSRLRIVKSSGDSSDSDSGNGKRDDKKVVFPLKYV